MTKTSKKNCRYFLLATVSAIALSVSIERGAHAADLAPICSANWWASAEGHYLMFGGSGPNAFGGSPDPKDGWGVAAEVGGRSCEGYSGVARVRYGRSHKESEYTFFTSTTSAGSGASYEESHVIADLEIGRDVGLGSMESGEGNVRVHAGLRFAYFDGESEGNYYYSSYVSADHKFVGIGPRIGIDANIPVSANAAFDLRAAGAVLFGTREVEGFYISTATSGSVSREDSAVIVPNVEASAALSYLLGENANIAVGYRVDHYWNVLDMNPFPGSTDKTSRTIHGPFIRLTVGGRN